MHQPTTWIYVRSEPGLYTVGHYTPEGKWLAESDHGSWEEAADRVAYLNGGAKTGGTELSKREWLAGMAMNGILSAEHDNREYGVQGYQEIAEASFAIADALLAQAKE